jgi:hypothetical protein
MRHHLQDVTDVEFREVVTLPNVWFYQDRTCPFMTYTHLQPQTPAAHTDLQMGVARGLSALQAGY